MAVKKKLGQGKYKKSEDDVPLVKAPSGPDKKTPAQMRKQLTEMARMRTLRRNRRLSRGN
jgi:hypothetical protein